MRIVLTGVSGQVGRALVGPLGGFGQVVQADRRLLDLAKPEKLTAALDRLAPDLIVNPAAYTAVDRAEDERELAFAVNAEAPGVIARWAAHRRVPLVHFSTDYVFDGRGETPWREDSQPLPLSVYGTSKFAGEEAIRAASGPHLIVRTSWVYAAQGANFLRTMARLGRERTELKVVADQVGAPTSASIIAEVVARLLKANLSDLAQSFARAEGIVNLSASGETTWYGFACRIFEGLRARGEMGLAVRSIVPIRTEEYPTLAPRPRNSRLDLTRLRETFEIVTPGWADGLEAALDQLVAQENGPR